MALSKKPGAGLGVGPDDATQTSSDATGNTPMGKNLNYRAAPNPQIAANTA